MAVENEMKNDRYYRYMQGDDIVKAKYALVLDDNGYMAQVLSKIKIKKEDFLYLCRIAIESQKLNSLQILLEIYHTFWTQDVFDELVSYIKKYRRYEMASFISEFIDKANAYHTSVKEWNEHVRENKRKKAEQTQATLEPPQPEKKPNVFQRIFRFLFKKK